MGKDIRICFIAAAQFEGTGVGSVVTNKVAFLGALNKALETYEFPPDGQGSVALGTEANDTVRAGTAHHTGNPDDYQVVTHRGEVVTVLDREMLSEEQMRPDSVAAIVYTAEAVLADPQVSDEDREYFQEHPNDLYLVTVLGFQGPPSTISSHRFTRNVAGGNDSFLLPEDIQDAAELRKWYTSHIFDTAQAVVEYEQEWCTVG
jgi:hypothetical protein